MRIKIAEKGFLDNALSEFQKTIQIEPRHSRAHNNIGNIYMLQGKFDIALKEYKRAVDTNPHNIEAIYNTGRVLEQTGNIQEAKIYYKWFIAIAPLEYSVQVIELKKHLEIIDQYQP